MDLSGLTAAQRETEVERLLIDEPRRLYDLESKPGLRVTLLRLGVREHVFILMMHHIICDRWSMGISCHANSRRCIGPPFAARRRHRLLSRSRIATTWSGSNG